MSDASIFLANAKRIATDQVTQKEGTDNFEVHRQKVVAIAEGISAGDIKSDWLKDGATVNMGVNGAPTVYKFNADTVPLLIRRVDFELRDSGTINRSGFGALAALTTGIKVEVFDGADASQLDFTAGQPIKTNGHWALLPGAELRVAGLSNGFGVQWDLDRGLGSGGLYLPKNYYLGVTIDDDLTGLADLRGYVTATPAPRDKSI